MKGSERSMNVDTFHFLCLVPSYFSFFLSSVLLGSWLARAVFQGAKF